MTVALGFTAGVRAPADSAVQKRTPGSMRVEVTRLAGTRHLDMPEVFRAVTESVKVTALQRGCVRRQPE